MFAAMECAALLLLAPDAAVVLAGSLAPAVADEVAGLLDRRVAVGDEWAAARGLSLIACDVSAAPTRSWGSRSTAEAPCPREEIYIDLSCKIKGTHYAGPTHPRQGRPGSVTAAELIAVAAFEDGIACRLPGLRRRAARGTGRGLLPVPATG